jgi:hypothetical protein
MNMNSTFCLPYLSLSLPIVSIDETDSSRSIPGNRLSKASSTPDIKAVFNTSSRLFSTTNTIPDGQYPRTCNPSLPSYMYNSGIQSLVDPSWSVPRKMIYSPQSAFNFTPNPNISNSMPTSPPGFSPAAANFHIGRSPPQVIPRKGRSMTESFPSVFPYPSGNNFSHPSGMGIMLSPIEEVAQQFGQMGVGGPSREQTI